MGPNEIASRAMVVVYAIFVGLVLAERFTHMDEAVARLRAEMDAQRARWAAESDYRRARLKMAYEVWEATGERVDLA